MPKNASDALREYLDAFGGGLGHTEGWDGEFSSQAILESIEQSFHLDKEYSNGVKDENENAGHLEDLKCCTSLPTGAPKSS